MQAPRIPSMFKLPQHKRFNFRPRYYDPVEEERKQRYAEYEKQYGSASVADEKQETRTISFKEEWKKRKIGPQAHRYSTLRLAVIVAALALLAYYVLMK